MKCQDQANPRSCSKLSISLLPNRVSACSQVPNLNHSQVPKIQDKPQAKKITDDSDQETIDSQDMSSIIQDLKTIEKQTSQGGLSQSQWKNRESGKLKHKTSSRLLNNDPQTLQSFDKRNDLINLHLQSTESLNKELFSFNDGLFSAQSKQMSLKELNQESDLHAQTTQSKPQVPHLKLNLGLNQKPLDTLTLIQGLQTIANGGGMSCRSNSSGRQRKRWDLSGGKSTLQNSFRKGSDTESLFDGATQNRPIENEDRLLKVNKSPLTQEHILKMNFNDDTCTKQYEQLQKQYQAIKQQLKYFKQLKSSQYTHSSQQNSHLHQQSLNSNSIFNQLKFDQSKISRALAKGENDDEDHQDFGTLVTEQQFFTQNQMSSDEDIRQNDKSNYSQEADGESQDDELLTFKSLKKAKFQGLSTTNAKQSRRQLNGNFKSIDLQQATKNILKTAMKTSTSPQIQLHKEKMKTQDLRTQTRYLEDSQQINEIANLKSRLAEEMQIMEKRKFTIAEDKRLERNSFETDTKEKKSKEVNSKGKASNSILKSQLQMGLRKLSESSSQFESKLYRNNQGMAPMIKQSKVKQPMRRDNNRIPHQTTVKKHGRAASNSQVSFVGVDSNDEQPRLKAKPKENQNHFREGGMDEELNQEKSKNKRQKTKEDQKQIRHRRKDEQREKESLRESSEDQAQYYRYDISRSEVARFDHERRKKSQTKVYNDRQSSRRDSSRGPVNQDFTASKKVRSTSRHERELQSTRGKQSSRTYEETPVHKNRSKSRKSKQNQSGLSLTNPWLPGYKTGLEAASMNLLQQQLALAQQLQSPQLFQTQMLQPMLIPNQAAYLGLPPLLAHQNFQPQAFPQQAASTLPSQTPLQNPSIISSFPISKMHSPSSAMAPLQLSQSKQAALKSQTQSIQNQKHFANNQSIYQQQLSAQSNSKTEGGHRTALKVEPIQLKSFEQHQEQIEVIESLIQQAKDKLYTNIISNTNQNCRLSSGRKDYSQINHSALNSTRVRGNMVQRQIIDMEIDRDGQSCQDEIESRNPEMNQFINQSLSSQNCMPAKMSQQLQNLSSRNNQRQVAESYNSNQSQQSRTQDRSITNRNFIPAGSRNISDNKLIFTTQNSNRQHDQTAFVNRQRDQQKQYSKGLDSSRTNLSRQVDLIPASDRSSLIAQPPDYRYQEERLRKVEQSDCGDRVEQRERYQESRDNIIPDRSMQKIPFEKRGFKKQGRQDSERQREKQKLIDEVVCQFVRDEDSSDKDIMNKIQEDSEKMLWIDFNDSKQKQDVSRRQQPIDQRMQGKDSSRQSEQLTSSRTHALKTNLKEDSSIDQNFTQVSKLQLKQTSQQKGQANGGWVMDFTEKPNSPSQQQQAQSIAEAFKNRLMKAEQKFKKSIIEPDASENLDAQKKDFTKEELYERKKELLKAARDKIKSKNAPSLEPLGDVSNQMSLPASKPPQHPGSQGNSGQSLSNPPPSLLTRLSSGKRAEVTKKDMLRLTSKNYEQLPEIQQRKKDSTKKEYLLKRIQQVKQLEIKRRHAVVSKQRQQQQQSVPRSSIGPAKAADSNINERSKGIE